MGLLRFATVCSVRGLLDALGGGIVRDGHGVAAFLGFTSSSCSVAYASEVLAAVIRVQDQRGLFMFMLALLVLRSWPLLGVAANHVGALMALLAMNAQPGLLLEGLLAAIDATLVWVELCVGVDVLHHVLALREAAATYYAFEPLDGFVNVDEVPLEAIQRGEGAIAVVVEAFDALGLEALALQHGLELALDLAFGVSGQLEADGETLHVVLLYFIVAVLVLMDVVLFANSVPGGLLVVRSRLLPREVLHLLRRASILYLELRVVGGGNPALLRGTSARARLLLNRLCLQALRQVRLLQSEALRLTRSKANIQFALVGGLNRLPGPRILALDIGVSMRLDMTTVVVLRGGRVLSVGSYT